MDTWLGLVTVAVVGELAACSERLLLRLGLTPPTHVLSDEKFASLDNEQIYLFLVSQGELIWYTEWLQQANETDE